MANVQPPPPQGQPKGPPGPMQGVPPLQPGQQPTPQQIQAMQRQLAIDAEKNGMTVPQFVEQLKKQALAQQQARMQQQQQAQAQAQAQQQQNQMQPIQPGPPKPEAIAVAKFLQSQDLKMRTCILNGQRKNMFKGRDPFHTLNVFAIKLESSKASTPRSAIRSIHQSSIQEPPPPWNHRQSISREHLQAPPALSPRTPCF